MFEFLAILPPTRAVDAQPISPDGTCVTDLSKVFLLDPVVTLMAVTPVLNLISIKRQEWIIKSQKYQICSSVVPHSKHMTTSPRFLRGSLEKEGREREEH